MGISLIVESTVYTVSLGPCFLVVNSGQKNPHQCVGFGLTELMSKNLPTHPFLQKMLRYHFLYCCWMVQARMLFVTF